jgi:hypothetical protein
VNTFPLRLVKARGRPKEECGVLASRWCCILLPVCIETHYRPPLCDRLVWTASRPWDGVWLEGWGSWWSGRRLQKRGEPSKLTPGFPKGRPWSRFPGLDVISRKPWWKYWLSRTDRRSFVPGFKGWGGLGSRSALVSVVSKCTGKVMNNKTCLLIHDESLFCYLIVFD